MATTTRVREHYLLGTITCDTTCSDPWYCEVCMYFIGTEG